MVMRYFVGIGNNLYMFLFDCNVFGKYYLFWWEVCVKRVLDNGEFFILKILRI